MRMEEVSNPRVELALDSLSRKFGEQDGMSDSKSQDMSRDSPDLLSDIEGLHPLLEE